MRISVISAVMAASLLWSAPLMAQNEDFGKSAVAQSLMKRAAPQNAQSKRIIAPPKTSTPYEFHEDIPDNVDDLMAGVEAQNGALVDEFEKLIEKDSLNPDAPKWLAQIAEFHWQMAHYSYLRARRSWLSALDACVDDESKCPPEPAADYSRSIADYRRLLANYPTYEHTDEVLFRLGDALIRNQQPKEGISYLHRLTQSYPNYKELDAAWLAMGEFYFSQKITGTAQAAYQKIIEEYPKSQYYQYAQYKLAWTYLNLADEDSYRTAIDLFKQVVESIDTQYASAIDASGQVDENKLKSGEVSFRNQALNDLSTTYAELPNGWKEARSYLNTKLPPEKARDKIEQLGGILNAQGKFEEELELYGDLIEQNPEHPHLVDWYMARIEAYKASNRMEDAENDTRKAIALLEPGKAWYRANENNASAIRTARRFSAEQGYILAMAAMAKAEKTSDMSAKDALWADAESMLRMEIQHYADDTSAFDLNYSFAYVLDERSDASLNQIKKQYGKRLKTEPQLASGVLEKLREAAQAYQKIVDWPDQGDAERQEQIRVAANRQVFVYANILASSDPEWSIINSAKAQNFVEEKRGSEVKAKEELSEAEEGFVRSAEQYAARYPKDDETPAFLWRAAEIYRTRNDYEQAAQRFDQIVTNFPDHQYAAVSVGSMFELYYKAQNYEKIEYWAKWLIEHKNFKHYTAKELEDTAVFAMDKQAVLLAESGKIDDAVSTIMRIESSFPKRSEHITSARFKAASFEESRKNYKSAVELLTPLETSAEPVALCARASYRIGMNESRRDNYQASADAFARAADLYFAQIDKQSADIKPDKKTSAKKAKSHQASEPDKVKSSIPADHRLESAQSVLYGTQIYQALGQKDKSAHLIDMYLLHNRQGEYDVYQVDQQMKVDISEEEKASAVEIMNNPRALLTRASLESPADGAARLSSAEGMAGQPLGRQISLQRIQYLIDARDLEKAKTAIQKLTPDESWTNGENARLAYLNGRCAQIEFEDVALEFPIRTLRKRIEEKAKKRQAAEKYYQQAISYKNAQISTASAYELAQMALNFRDAFKNLPAPKELENAPDGLEEYTTWIEDELVFPAEDAAASLLDVARQITVQLQSYTPQALESAKSLAELKPDEYPVTHASIE